MKKELMPLDAALAALLAQARAPQVTETIETLAAHGRVLAQDVVSTLNVPPMDNSSMDGYALRVADLGAGPLKIAQRIPAGAVGSPLAAGTAARIFTGAMIPAGADAVVMQEQCAAEGDRLTVNHEPKAGEWIRHTGDDIKQGATVLKRGARLDGAACGLAASVGMAKLEVFPRLKVAVFFTGDELAMPGEPLKPGAIYNSNRFMLRGLIEGLGCTCTDFGIVRDTLDETRSALRRAAAEHDLIITTGGVSVGEEDHVRPAVEAEGRIDLWQIAVKPGKPLAHGRVRRAAGSEASEADFIGLPGNPVSAFVTFLLLVRPFILARQGASVAKPAPFKLRADFDWPKPDRRREFLRVRRNAEGGLELFPNQSSGVLTSCVWADGLVDNPPQQVIARGDLVNYLPLHTLLS